MYLEGFCFVFSVILSIQIVSKFNVSIVKVIVVTLFIKILFRYRIAPNFRGQIIS